MVVFASILREASLDDSAGDLISRGLPAYLVACVAYALAAWNVPSRVRPAGSSVGRGRAQAAVALLWILVVAAAIRISVWFAPAVAGSDYYRYLWDGAVAASGENPYDAAPQEVVEHAETLPPRVAELSHPGREVLAGINHPELRTLYPPGAQAMFALAHRVAPFDLLGWRLVLLAADIAAAVAVALIAARRPGAPTERSLILYMWNPLIVLETYFGCHLDLAAAALTLIALSAADRGRMATGAVFLALAAGIKVWPVLMIGLLLRTAQGDRARLVRGIVVFGIVSGPIAIAYASAFTAGDSGARFYAAGWHANAGVYTVLERAMQAVGLSRIAAERTVRAALAGATVGYAFWIARRPVRDGDDLYVRAGIVVLVMLLLSPTLYPWYALALIPLAAVRPLPSRLAWTFLLPAVYLAADGWLGQRFIPVLVHAPVWLLLLCELRRGSNGRRNTRSLTHA
jgi:hypothetical protein